MIHTNKDHSEVTAPCCDNLTISYKFLIIQFLAEKNSERSGKMKRRKHPRLPNGYGTIRFLGKGRRNPYAVHPPVTEFTIDGVPITPKALCYVDDWYKGFAVLTAYKAGTYYTGYELTLDKAIVTDSKLAEKILADYNRTKSADRNKSQGLTFSQVYEDFCKWKFNDRSSRNTVMSYENGYIHCSNLHDREFIGLRYKDLQETILQCDRGQSTKQNIIKLIHQMYRYAMIAEIIDKDYSKFISVNSKSERKSGQPFSDDDLRVMWNNNHGIISTLLIMCYSGFRISEYKTLEINLEQCYFRGGIKTKSGKNRIVPIHSAILPMVRESVETQGKIIPCEYVPFLHAMKRELKKLGIKERTPHDCRHTFSRLCEKYEVRENDRKRMLGHSFSDVTNAVYGHRQLDDLRKEMEKIQCY